MGTIGNLIFVSSALFFLFTLVRHILSGKRLTLNGYFRTARRNARGLSRITRTTIRTITRNIKR